MGDGLRVAALASEEPRERPVRREVVRLRLDRRPIVTLRAGQFADVFEDKFTRQGPDENRTIEGTIELGWELLTLLPRAELKRIRQEYIDRRIRRPIDHSAAKEASEHVEPEPQ